MGLPRPRSRPLSLLGCEAKARTGSGSSKRGKERGRMMYGDGDRRGDLNYEALVAATIPFSSVCVENKKRGEGRRNRKVRGGRGRVMLIYIPVRQMMEGRGQGRGSVLDYRQELRRGKGYLWSGGKINKGDTKINPAQMTAHTGAKLHGRER